MSEPPPESPSALPEDAQSRRSRSRSAEPAAEPTEAEQAWYLAHFNQHVEHLHRHRYGAVTEGSASLADPPSSHRRQNNAVLPSNSSWTTQEKDAFFGGLARHSRWRPDLIAADIGSKTEGQVVWYSETLRAMSVDLEQEEMPRRKRLDRQPWQAGFAPAAREVSQDWVAKEEQLARALSASELRWEREARIMARDKATSSAARKLKKRKRSEVEASQRDGETGEQALSRPEVLEAMLVNATLRDMRAVARVLKARRHAGRQDAAPVAQAVNGEHAEAVASLRATLVNGMESSGDQGESLAPQDATAQAAWAERIAHFDPIFQKALLKELIEEQRYTQLQQIKKKKRSKKELEEHRRLGLLINTRLRDRRNKAVEDGIEAAADDRPSAVELKIRLMEAQGKLVASAASKRRHAAQGRSDTERRSMSARAESEANVATVEVADARQARRQHKAKTFRQSQPDKAFIYDQLASMLTASASDIFDLKVLVKLFTRDLDKQPSGMHLDILPLLRAHLVAFLEATIARCVASNEILASRRGQNGMELEAEDIWETLWGPMEPPAPLANGFDGSDGEQDPEAHTAAEPAVKRYGPLELLDLHQASVTSRRWNGVENRSTPAPNSAGLSFPPELEEQSNDNIAEDLLVEMESRESRIDRALDTVDAVEDTMAELHLWDSLNSNDPAAFRISVFGWEVYERKDSSRKRHASTATTQPGGSGQGENATHGRHDSHDPNDSPDDRSDHESLDEAEIISNASTRRPDITQDLARKLVSLNRWRWRLERGMSAGKSRPEPEMVRKGRSAVIVPSDDEADGMES